jgi:hypothetical protein
MKICYIERAFSGDSVATIATANQILEEYAAQGYDLTLRQLYYQFVSRGLIANKDSEYKKLGSVINDARLAGKIDWDHITDRTRNLRALAHWESPRDIVDACANQFRFDKWAEQENYVEVWVEKDALVGVLQVACEPLDVPYFSCRGYTSQSEMWAAAMRLLKQVRAGKEVYVIHLGDHDPSGIDMSRDIKDRIELFVNYHLSGAAFTLNRIALNMDQVEEYNPPPNPAKVTDSRAAKYIDEYGNESWELDALEPRVLTALIQSTVAELRDEDLWQESLAGEEKAKDRLRKAARAL